MLKKLFFILFIFHFQISQAQLADQLYSLPTKIGYSQLLLCKNKTFEEHSVNYHGHKLVVKGKWFNNGDTLIINTDIQSQIIAKKDTSHNDSITIRIIKPVNGAENDFIKVTIYGDTFTIDDTTGFITIPSRTILKIGVYDFPNSYSIYFDKNELNDTKEMTIKLAKTNDLNTSIIRNEKWLRRTNKIYTSMNRIGKYDMEVFYELTNLKNKKF